MILPRKPTYEELTQRVRELEKTESEWGKTRSASKKRLGGPVRPLEDSENVAFEDLFDLEDIQRLQDDFAGATNVASIITRVDGTPITRPSNFCRLCRDIIRQSDRGLANCFTSDAMIGRLAPEGPIVQPCISGGLWDAGAGISVGGRHIANWLIGQVRDETQTEDRMRAYAREIGVDESAMLKAFREVPSMSQDRFKAIAQMLFTLANQISRIAYQNMQQARFIAVQKQAEGALKESETYLRTLIRTLPDLVWLKDRKGVYLFCNSRFESFFGTSEKDIIGKTDYDFVDKELADFFRKHDKMAMAAGTASRNEEEVLFAADGHREILETIKTPMYGSDGQLAGVMGIGRDITERKQAEIKLRESAERYRRIFENSVVGIFQSTPQGRFISVNPTMAAMLHYDDPAALVAAVTDIRTQFYVNPGDRDRHQRILQDKGKADGFECEVRCKDGSTIWVSMSTRAFFDDHGKVVCYEGVVSDISDRRRAEMNHEESEIRYRSLVENTLVGYFVVELPSGKFIFLNQRICELFGYTRQEALSLTVWDVIDPEEHALIRERIRERMEGLTESFTDYSYRAIRKDGSTFKVEVSTSLVTYKGKPVLQGLLRDITEKERLQLQLQQAQKMESVGRLAGGVAHDFNNMLNVIIGYTELAMDKIQPAEPMHADLQEILAAAKRSTDITRQLLAFARKQTIAPKVLDLNETVASMLKMLRRLIGEDIDLAWHPKAGLEPVKIDPAQVDQILANLCVNARDAIADVGRITIETAAATLDENYCAEHAGFVPGDFVMLAVSDDGCGMDRQTLDKIFEPFFTTKEVGRGTGLGLATVYGIVKQNNGFINAYSEPGKGSTFKVYLPRHAGEAIAGRSAGSLDIPESHGELVLVVEDEASILKLAERILDSLGYRVLLAKTPAEALRLIEAHSGDLSLLVTDVIMPGMNGRELSKRARSLSPAIKCLFMSGYTADAIAHRGILEEGVNFIQKPFSKKELAVKVRGVLDS